MKIIFVNFIIFSFIAVAVFGFMAMNHNIGHESKGCIAVVQGIDCKNTAGDFNLALFHINAFKGFSTALFNKSFISVFLLFIFCVFFIKFWRKKNVYILLLKFLNLRKIFYFLESFFNSFIKELNHWLSLHENSPTVIF